MTDVVDYDVGWGPLGGLARMLMVKRSLRKIFAYRAKVMAARFG